MTIDDYIECDHKWVDRTATRPNGTVCVYQECTLCQSAQFDDIMDMILDLEDWQAGDAYRASYLALSHNWDNMDDHWALNDDGEAEETTHD